ncbi:MAG: hypothetical protein IKI11_01115 [Neisseriaceae bacterium]|nr:hypothetical protein [Neisseriaceae bacterium]
MIKKYLLIFMVQLFCMMQAFAFDTNDFIKEIQNLDKNNPKQTQQLILFSQEWQKKNIKNLNQLRQSAEDKQFIDNWLLEQSMIFLDANIYTRPENIEKFKIIEKLFQKNMQEKVDFLIKNRKNLNATLQKYKSMEVCVGGPCGHETEVYQLSYMIQDIKASKSVNLDLVNQINELFNYDWKSYSLQLSSIKYKDKRLSETLNKQFIDKTYPELSNFQKKYKEQLDGLNNYFFHQYLTELYSLKYYLYLYYKEYKIEDVEKLLEQDNSICKKHPEFLNRKIRSMCNKNMFK